MEVTLQQRLIRARDEIRDSEPQQKFSKAAREAIQLYAHTFNEPIEGAHVQMWVDWSKYATIIRVNGIEVGTINSITKEFEPYSIHYTPIEGVTISFLS